MKKTILLILVILTFVCSLQAQRKQQGRRFVYMTSVGCVGGIGHVDLIDDDGAAFKRINNDMTAFQISQLFAYRFNPYVMLGLAAGFDIWRTTAFIPVYANLTVDFCNTRIAPLCYVNAGASGKWYIQSKPQTNDRIVHGMKWGPSCEAGLGLRIKFNDRLSLLLAACYRLQRSVIGYSYDNEQFSEYYTNRSLPVNYHFIGAKIGIAY